MGLKHHLMLTGFLSIPSIAEANWSPAGLALELYPIAHLESSWGKNMSHQAHSKGDWYSAQGALGLKAITAYESMFLSKSFISKWSIGDKQTVDITNKEVFFKLLSTNSQFYNELASTHWRYLRQNTADVEQAVFAWRWGLGAAFKTSNIAIDKYVIAYKIRLARG